MIFAVAEYWDRFGFSPENLMERAHEYSKQAYAPYSKFSVGAALLTEEGEVVGGCNVENASYGMSLCAERVAMSNAVLRGCRRPLAIAVASSHPAFCPPCGACRQFLSEFNPDIDVLLSVDGQLAIYRLDSLLPLRFKLDIA
ncbi:MAG: cytidine deaminase [Synergistaceae bacterium]|jgi:cytidine deaminase|nr:cytidine deaminase [Synergistaceae bacterium]